MEDIGVTEDIKEESAIEKLNQGRDKDDIISVSNIKKRMMEWKRNGTSSTDGMSIEIPEDDEE